MTKPAIATAQALLQVTMLLMRSFSANMRRGGEEGLEPAQVGILMHIGMQVCTLSELAQHLSVRLPTVSRSVSVLVNAGLIKRWTPEDNRRISLLDLTIAGRKKLTSFKNLADQHVVSILAPLTSVERTQVDVALKNLIKVMKQ
ncbi:MAG: MarR family winged helix-turn-helix transcriptional regulator [Pseudohongiellaceae bacterium]|jgi:DNA-binding MarR family transcriptional regulator